METVYTIGQLKEILNDLNDNDQVVLETINLETGDVEDLFNFYVDIIDGIELTDGSNVREVRFTQQQHTDKDGNPIVVKYPMTLNEFLSNIDFKQLKNQKQFLIKELDEFEKNTPISEMLYHLEGYHLQGLINLIDSLQDYAVDVMHIKEDLVFDTDEEPIGYIVTYDGDDSINDKVPLSKAEAEEDFEVVKKYWKHINWKLKPIFKTKYHKK